MKKLYYSCCSYAAPHTGVLMDYMITDVKEGHQVVWSYCHGVQSSCFINKNANGAKCKICHILYKGLIRECDHNIDVKPLKMVSKKDAYAPFDYKDSSELRAIVYKGVSIGLSILSFYISETRNMKFEIGKENRKYFDYLLRENCAFVDRIYEIVDEVKPDCICIYNGRYYENRALYDIARMRGLKFESAEVVGGFNEPYRCCKYVDSLPHSIKKFTEGVHKSWDESEDSEEHKMAIGTDFYEKRKNGVAAADKVYITSQIKGLLPEGFDTSKKNYIIFNSSSDEIASIGGEWDEGENMFESQYEAIRFLCQNSSPDIHFTLRIHPNLRGIPYTYHTDLYKLTDEFSNITVIPPESKISSYALLDFADKVIVFGSTMGVEACYWRKPSILIGKSWYLGLDVCHKPSTRCEIIRLINSDIKPKSKLDAIKYAYFLLDRKVRVKQTSNINVDVRYIDILGKKVQITPYMRLCGSRLFAKLLQTVYTNVLIILFRNKNTISG